MSKRQASILAAFSRQQEAQAKRRKASDAALPDDEATVRRRRVGAELAAVERGQSADASDGETGSVTDGDLLSSQEDVQDAGWGGSGGSGGDRGERGATDASAAFVDERRSGAAVVGAGEREAPAVVEDVVDKVGGMELNVAAKMSLSIARTKLHTQKEIKDSVHGLISFESICMRIIDTLQFQRLRNLHQLGAAHYVYIGATHSRFEHCLGVAYLAEQMVQSIRTVQPWLPITKTDVLCIKIAGLCHDLGHGPFSHVFDGIFVDQLRRQRILKESFRWTHERGSLDMLDHLLVSNCIDVADYGLSELDLVFIKELIYGGPLPGNSNLCGRPANDQRFLYDFVNNSKSGLDVDKLDYFMRDSLHTGAKMSCDTALLIRGARVLADEEDGGRTMAICFPEKLAGQVMQAFHTRYELHHSVYQHKGVRAIEYMVCDVLVAAHEHLRIKNKLVSEVFYCMDAYQHLDDRVLARIQDSEGPELEAARAILNRIFTKPYYEYVGQTPVTTHSRAKSEDMLLNEILYCSSRRSLVQSKDQIILEFMRIHYGKGAEDPLNHVRFYSKSAVASSSCYRLPPEAYEMFCPKQFEERSIRVFVKDPSLSFVVREALEIWARKFNRSVLLPIGSSR